MRAVANVLETVAENSNSFNRPDLKICPIWLILLVGAARFELTTLCAQGIGTCALVLRVRSRLIRTSATSVYSAKCPM